MGFRETKINFAIWLYPEKKDYFYTILFLSLIFHIFCAIFLLNLENNSKKDKITYTAQENTPIHIQFNKSYIQSTPLKQKEKKNIPENIPENSAGGVLTDKNPYSQSKTLVPEELVAKNFQSNKQPLVTKRLPSDKNKNLPPAITHKSNRNQTPAIDHFLPHSNPAYIDEIRKYYNQVPKIEGDAGDIPIYGDDDYTPSNSPKIKERYSVQDLSLVQFSQYFKEKFSGIWYSHDRIVPPSSPLRPGEVIYYKLYIKGDGTLLKFENLTQKRSPQKDFTAVDKMVDDVVTKVFPLSLPGKFAKNIVTEIIAIQVVGRNSPVQYSFQ